MGIRQKQSFRMCGRYNMMEYLIACHVADQIIPCIAKWYRCLQMLETVFSLILRSFVFRMHVQQKRCNAGHMWLTPRLFNLFNSKCDELLLAWTPWTEKVTVHWREEETTQSS